MFCNKCGNQLADNSSFCGKCGAKLGVAPTPTPVESPRLNVAANSGAVVQSGNKKLPVIIGVVIVLLIGVIILLVALLGKGSPNDSGQNQQLAADISTSENSGGSNQNKQTETSARIVTDSPKETDPPRTTKAEEEEPEVTYYTSKDGLYSVPFGCCDMTLNGKDYDDIEVTNSSDTIFILNVYKNYTFSYTFAWSKIKDGDTFALEDFMYSSKGAELSVNYASFPRDWGYTCIQTNTLMGGEYFKSCNVEFEYYDSETETMYLRFDGEYEDGTEKGRTTFSGFLVTRIGYKG